jgi:hypothetical protein
MSTPRLDASQVLSILGWRFCLKAGVGAQRLRHRILELWSDPLTTSPSILSSANMTKWMGKKNVRNEPNLEEFEDGY